MPASSHGNLIAVSELLHRTRILVVLGRVGFATKACLYAGIGWLACASAVSTPQNESPQGVFLLLGSQRGAWGEILLLATLLGLCCYICWRFSEGLSGQGSAPHFSAVRNFFTYRLSPLVSGVVYVAYSAFVGFLLLRPPRTDSSQAPSDGCFPSCWTESPVGLAALSLLTLAFAIGVVTQLVPAVSGSFEQEMDCRKLERSPSAVRSVFLLGGRVGFLARAALFALVAVYFARIALGAHVSTDLRHSTVAQALNQLRAEPSGRGLLFVVGAGLVVYGAFALANVFFRTFPTATPPARAVDPGR
jgi:hypothetical protein